MLFDKSVYLCSVKKNKGYKVMKRIVVLSTAAHRGLIERHGALLSLVSKTVVSKFYGEVRLYFDSDDDFSVFSAGLYHLAILHRCVIL